MDDGRAASVWRLCPVSEDLRKLLETVIETLLAALLIVAMTWIVLSPQAGDEVSKAALVIVASVAGFLFGRHTAQ